MNSQAGNQIIIEKLKKLKCFELTDLFDAFSDEPQELVDLLKGFKERHANMFKEIKTNLDEKNIVHAKEIVHKLKGTAGNVGAVVLAEAATNLDAELRLSDYLPATLQKLEEAFNLTMIDLEIL